jgi:hypothetical protein
MSLPFSPVISRSAWSTKIWGATTDLFWRGTIIELEWRFAALEVCCSDCCKYFPLLDPKLLFDTRDFLGLASPDASFLTLWIGTPPAVCYLLTYCELMPPIADFDDFELVGLTPPILFSFIGTSYSGALQTRLGLNWARVVWINGSLTFLSGSPAPEIV